MKKPSSIVSVYGFLAMTMLTGPIVTAADSSCYQCGVLAPNMYAGPPPRPDRDPIRPPILPPIRPK